MSTTLGQLAHTRGKESSSRQVVGGTIFVDHATGFIVHNHQSSLSAISTIASKSHCEKIFDSYGIRVKGYAADNQPFRSKEWTNDCALKRQLPPQYSGVGAHHQNFSERSIQTIFIGAEQ